LKDVVLVVLEQPVHVPVTVIEEVPGGVEAEVLMVSVVEQFEPSGLHEVGENIAVAPLGSPDDTEKLTVQTEQADVAVMVVAPEAP
jgi:hypothetical protein